MKTFIYRQGKSFTKKLISLTLSASLSVLQLPIMAQQRDSVVQPKQAFIEREVFTAQQQAALYQTVLEQTKPDIEKALDAYNKAVGTKDINDTLKVLHTTAEHLLKQQDSFGRLGKTSALINQKDAIPEQLQLSLLEDRNLVDVLDNYNSFAALIEVIDPVMYPAHLSNMAQAAQIMAQTVEAWNTNGQEITKELANYLLRAQLRLRRQLKLIQTNLSTPETSAVRIWYRLVLIRINRFYREKGLQDPLGNNYITELKNTFWQETERALESENNLAATGAAVALFYFDEGKNIQDIVGVLESTDGTTRFKQPHNEAIAGAFEIAETIILDPKYPKKGRLVFEDMIRLATQPNHSLFARITALQRLSSLQEKECTSCTLNGNIQSQLACTAADFYAPLVAQRNYNSYGLDVDEMKQLTITLKDIYEKFNGPKRFLDVNKGEIYGVLGIHYYKGEPIVDLDPQVFDPESVSDTFASFEAEQLAKKVAWKVQKCNGSSVTMYPRGYRNWFKESADLNVAMVEFIGEMILFDGAMKLLSPVFRAAWGVVVTRVGPLTKKALKIIKITDGKVNKLASGSGIASAGKAGSGSSKNLVVLSENASVNTQRGALKTNFAPQTKASTPIRNSGLAEQVSTAPKVEVAPTAPTAPTVPADAVNPGKIEQSLTGGLDTKIAKLQRKPYSAPCTDVKQCSLSADIMSAPETGTMQSAKSGGFWDRLFNHAPASPAEQTTAAALRSSEEVAAASKTVAEGLSDDAFKGLQRAAARADFGRRGSSPTIFRKEYESIEQAGRNLRQVSEEFDVSGNIRAIQNLSNTSTGYKQAGEYIDVTLDMVREQKQAIQEATQQFSKALETPTTRAKQFKSVEVSNRLDQMAQDAQSAITKFENLENDLVSLKGQISQARELQIAREAEDAHQAALAADPIRKARMTKLQNADPAYTRAAKKEYEQMAREACNSRDWEQANLAEKRAAETEKNIAARSRQKADLKAQRKQEAAANKQVKQARKEAQRRAEEKEKAAQKAKEYEWERIGRQKIEEDPWERIGRQEIEDAWDAGRFNGIGFN